MKIIKAITETTWGIILLITLLFTIFILPVLKPELQSIISPLVYTLLYFSALLSLERRNKMLLVLSIFAFLMSWISGIFDFMAVNSISKSLNIVFFLWMVINLIRQIATPREVTLKVILGSVIGYLLLGLVSSIFINYILVHDPAAFNVSGADGANTAMVTRMSESVYFSFVSLATLGYGDILPLKPYSRSLAILITVSGQLYIAIIIALLVGKFAAGNNEEESRMD